MYYFIEITSSKNSYIIDENLIILHNVKISKQMMCSPVGDGFLKESPKRTIKQLLEWKDVKVLDEDVSLEELKSRVFLVIL